MLPAEHVIRHFGLQPLPKEGGLFRQTYCAAETIPVDSLPLRYRRDKPFATAILYLLTSAPDSFSALHRLPTDEIYHFYLGDPVELLLLHPQRTSEQVILGQDIQAGQQVQFVVPRGVWQGSRLVPGGRWALLGTTMAPGYDDEDYQHGVREDLIRDYPEEADRIRLLTRPA